MDFISIQKLKVKTIIGIHDWEKKIKQTLLLDIELGHDSQAAASSDSIKDAVDYKAVSNSAKQFAEKHHFQLIETLANKLCKKLLNEFPIQTIKLAVHKPGAIPDARGVSILIERCV